MDGTNLPPCSWLVRRGKGRRFLAHKENVTVDLQGIRRQIERNHFPYHIVKQQRPPWIRRYPIPGSRMAGLEGGRLFDREVENALHYDRDHFIFAHLAKHDLFPVAAKVLVTNAETEGKTKASCAEIDLVAFNRRTGYFACVEMKRTTKCMSDLLKEEERSPRCRRTKRKRHFLDMARLQAQLCAIFLQNTYNLQTVESYLLVLSSNADKSAVENVDVLKLELVDRLNVDWIVGYDEK